MDRKLNFAFSGFIERLTIKYDEGKYYHLQIKHFSIKKNYTLKVGHFLLWFLCSVPKNLDFLIRLQRSPSFHDTLLSTSFLDLCISLNQAFIYNSNTDPP